jgi:hypothetical protein
MADTTKQEVFCGDCGAALDEQPSQPPEKRKPCPDCGSSRRRFAVQMEEAAVKIRSSLRVKAKAGGKGEPFQEEKIGDDYWWKAGRWTTVQRLIDRRRNRYVERIADPETGEIIKDVDEPLTEHRGHGSDRKPREP